MSYPALTTLVGFGANPKTAIDDIDWTSLSKVEADGIKSYLRALHSADRGRTRERERTEPGLSEFTLDNRDRRFEPEYAETGGLDLPGSSPNYAFTADASHFDITGDTEITVKVKLDAMTTGQLYGRDSQTGIRFLHISTGTLRIDWHDGTSYIIGPTSSAHGVGVGTTIYFRVKFDVDNGASERVILYEKSTDGITWTQISSHTQAGATQIATSAAAIAIGRHDSGVYTFNGVIYKAEQRNGIGGNIVASPDFTKQPTGTTSFTDAQGNVWTVNGANSKVTLASPYSPNVLPGKPVRHGLGYMPLVRGTEPVAYWRLGEAGAGLALDEITGENNLANVGSGVIGGASGRIRGNTAWDFDGTINAWARTDFFTSTLAPACTLAVWFQWDASGVEDRLIVGGSSTLFDFGLRTTTGNKLQATMVDAGATTRNVTSATSVNGGAWHFGVLTWDGITLRLYLNGVAEGTPVVPGVAARDSGDRVILGAGPGTGTNNFDGRLDEVAVWDRALAAAEVKSLYDEGLKNIEDGWIWHGYMEGWPPSYSAFGKDAVTNAVATDALAVLALDDIDPPYPDSVLRRSPNGFWRLEGSGDTPDASGANRDGLLSPDASFIESEGSYSENAVFIVPPVVGGRALNAGSVSFPSDASIVGTGPFTILIWINHITTPDFAFGLGTGSWFTQGDYATNGIVIEQSASSLFCRTREGGLTSQVVGSIGNDHFYFVAFVREVDGTLRVYLDGTLDATTVTPTQRSLVAGTLTARLGGTGPIAEPAIIPSALTLNQIAEIYGARLGLANDKSGARIDRVLDAISWPSGDRDIDAGRSSLQEQDQQTTALAHVLDVAEWESGYFFPTKAGTLRFDDRHARLTSPLNASQATFAWSPTGSEKGIRGAGLDHHWRNVKNYIRVERINGSTAIAQDTASRTSYGRRVETRTTKVVLDLEALSDAQWTLFRKKDPRYELEYLEIHPGSDDELWTQVLAREIGDRITVIFRPPGGGAELSRDFHIEHVHHECTTPITKDWLTRWRLSAADTNSHFQWDVSKWDTDALWAH